MTKPSVTAAERRAERQQRQTELLAVLADAGKVGIATGDLARTARHDPYIMRKDLLDLVERGVVQKSSPKKTRGPKIVRWRLRQQPAAVAA